MHFLAVSRRHWRRWSCFATVARRRRQLNTAVVVLANGKMLQVHLSHTHMHTRTHTHPHASTRAQTYQHGRTLRARVWSCHTCCSHGFHVINHFVKVHFERIRCHILQVSSPHLNPMLSCVCVCQTVFSVWLDVTRAVVTERRDLVPCLRRFLTAEHLLTVP
jgi:hypothetical protein